LNPLDPFPQKLSKPEESALAQGSSKDLEKLVLHSMREAVTYARHISKGHIEDGELISICYDVLRRGAKRWKTGWARFFAFCKPGIRGYVHRSWREKDVVKGVDRENVVSIGSIESSTAVARNLKGTDSLNVWDDADEVTPEHEIDNPEFDKIHMKERWAMVKKVLDRCCTEREKAVLSLTYQSGRNFQEIAQMLDLTRSAIQRTHRVALRKIRVVLLDQGRLLAD
jgi:RNA polymerase sigma factor (sigma-70 family)